MYLSTKNDEVLKSIFRFSLFIHDLHSAGAGLCLCVSVCACVCVSEQFITCHLPLLIINCKQLISFACVQRAVYALCAPTLAPSIRPRPLPPSSPPARCRRRATKILNEFNCKFVNKHWKIWLYALRQPIWVWNRKCFSPSTVSCRNVSLLPRGGEVWAGMRTSCCTSSFGLLSCQQSLPSAAGHANKTHRQLQLPVSCK